MLQISALSRAYEVLNFDAEVAGKALKLAAGSATFVKKHLFNESTGELRRSYREGQGPTGQADDYAFLIQGLLLVLLRCRMNALTVSSRTS